MLINLLFENPFLFFGLAASLILSLTFHEFAHAYVAYRLGDPTAKYLGRITLNPLKHLDPIGTISLLFLGFGWGRPVPFNPANLKNPKKDGGLIAIAGPVSNLILVVVFTLIFHFGLRFGVLNAVVLQFSVLMITYNLLLAFFNLLPISPLDGFKVVYGILPNNLAIQWVQFEKYGFIILLLLVFTGSVGIVLSPILDFALNILGISS